MLRSKPVSSHSAPQPLSLAVVIRESFAVFAELNDVLDLALGAKAAPHVLADVRAIPSAPDFLEAVADHLAGRSRKPREPFDSIVDALASRLPTGVIERHALENLIRDLIWEIGQPQFG